ncbi:unnamed protein product [Rotaria socialis]
MDIWYNNRQISIVICVYTSNKYGQTCQLLEQFDILTRSETYIDSNKSCQEEIWISDETTADTSKIIKRKQRLFLIFIKFSTKFLIHTSHLKYIFLEKKLGITIYCHTSIPDAGPPMKPHYGKLMIMADQDQDGSHMKDLVVNLIQYKWSNLLKHDYIEVFITPILKITKDNYVIPFYSILEFE